MVAEHVIKNSAGVSGQRSEFNNQNLLFQCELNWTHYQMAAKITIPTFSKSKSYELYEQELLAWKEITDLDKKNQVLP